jgi:hypothetical protein
MGMRANESQIGGRGMGRRTDLIRFVQNLKSKT